MDFSRLLFKLKIDVILHMIFLKYMFLLEKSHVTKFYLKLYTFFYCDLIWWYSILACKNTCFSYDLSIKNAKLYTFLHMTFIIIIWSPTMLL